MAFTHVLTHSVNVGGTVITTSNSYSTDGRTSLVITLPANTPDYLVNVQIDVTQIKSLYMLETGNNDRIGIYTNQLILPDDTIYVYDGIPIVWWTPNCLLTCPFTVDVTKIYLGNFSVTLAATFKLEIIHDATP